jgi:hypothetical protein
VYDMYVFAQRASAPFDPPRGSYAHPRSPRGRAKALRPDFTKALQLALDRRDNGGDGRLRPQ